MMVITPKDWAIPLGLEPVPEVLLHPSAAERFTRCAPKLLRKPRERHQPVRLSSCPASANPRSPAAGCGMPYVCE